MKNFAEFQITGRVERIELFDSAMRVSVTANYHRQDDTWTLGDEVYWNEVLIFRQATRNYITDYVQQGDIVYVRGRLRPESFTDRNGEQRYTTNLIATDFGLVAKKQLKNGDNLHFDRSRIA